MMSKSKAKNTHLTHDRVERERKPSPRLLDSTRIALRRETGAADLSAASNDWEGHQTTEALWGRGRYIRGRVMHQGARRGVGGQRNGEGGAW